MVFYFPDQQTSLRALAELPMTTEGEAISERKEKQFDLQSLRKQYCCCDRDIRLIHSQEDVLLKASWDNRDIPKLSQKNTFLSKADVNHTNISSITPVQNPFLVLASPLHLNKRGVIRVTISIPLGQQISPLIQIAYSCRSSPMSKFLAFCDFNINPLAENGPSSTS